MSSDYVKQLEETVESLNKKLNTIFVWKVVKKTWTKPTAGIAPVDLPFEITHECYINDQLYAVIGDNDVDIGGHKAVLFGTVICDFDINSLFREVERCYMRLFINEYC